MDWAGCCRERGEVSWVGPVAEGLGGILGGTEEGVARAAQKA